jgi:nitroreductase
MELEEAILRRTSVRYFKDEPVSEEDIKKLVKLL